MDRALSEPNPSSGFPTWVLKSARFLKIKARVKSRVCRKRFEFDGMVVNNSVYRASPNHLVARMEGVKIRVLNKEESEESSSSSDLLASEVTLNCENSSEGSSSSPSLGWAMHKDKLPRCHSFAASEEVEKPSRNLERQGSCILSETEMMKERFSKLLLGEDMSGCGNGVCAALAISNAVTNLYATLFGQVWRLEPLQRDKKSMWRREMQCILCINDHIVELIPTWQTFPDGSKLEVMTSRPRSDLYINLPALRKLDNMLLDVLDSFESSEFWYVDQGVLAPETDGSSSFRNPLPRQQDKWWLPVPQVPPGGLTQDTRKMLQHMRDCTSQILKAAKAINASVLAEMKIPHPYLEALPKNGKSSLGDLIYRYINSEQFSPECLLDCLDLSSEHHALEIANRVEAAVHVWRRRMSSKPSLGALRSSSRSSWELVKDLVSDGDKQELLAGRAESLLLCLKQRFPGLTQTTLDTAKIQYNKDVGKSILESYSRVLESLAFNIVARIDDLIYVDDLSMHSDQVVSISKVESAVTPYKTASTTPSFSPSLFISPAKGDRSSPYLENYRQPLTGTGLSSTKRVFTDQQPSRGGKAISFMSRLDSFSSKTTPSSPSSRGSTSLSMHESVQDG